MNTPLVSLFTAILLSTLAPAQDWQAVRVPGAWEPQVGPFDGFAWYRCFVEIPADWRGSRLLLTVRAIDHVDEAYFNGTRVGANGGMPPLLANPSSDVRRPAVIDPDLVRFGQPNLVAFRVFDPSGEGGIVEGPIQLGRLTDAIDLSGTWDFIPGDQKEFAHWPDQDPDGAAADRLLASYAARHPDQPAGQRGVVPADLEGRERNMALVRQRFEGNTNVHSNVEGKGPPRAPEEALDALVPGEALALETVLHEPLVTQPLYVEFDARGRMWVTQYIQYPKPAGLEVLTWDNHLRSIFDVVPPPPPYRNPQDQKFIGRDKITIHEDTNGDGHFDHHKTFLDGLNIVTSTCQGDQGVWILNPPYLLFYHDANGDDIPDGDPEVHLSGFGLEDTHSVANSLKWGPDGWLYGCTGSTVTARIKVHASPDRPALSFFGQNIWRYHPHSHAFELFAEGGWNNFGVDFDATGRLFSGTNGGMQAVHFVQGGFYQKGFGKHGPHTNPHAFDYFHGIPIEGQHPRLVQQWLPYTGGAWPDYEDTFIGVNCLANRVPVIVLERDGSTFRSHERLPAAIESDDVWFRPVHAALGPDGHVYVSDFYDARITHVDPRDNWDRAHGRIYRLHHRSALPHPTTDLTRASTVELVERLDHPNQWQRWTARRLLRQRQDNVALAPLRKRLSREGQGALEALWTLHVMDALDEPTALQALRHPDPQINLWTVRLLGDARQPLPPSILAEFLRLTQSQQSDVVSQLASTLQRLPLSQALPLLESILQTQRFSSDPYIPSQLWWALEKQITRDTERTVSWLAEPRSPIGETKLAFLIGRRLAADPTPANLRHAASLLEHLRPQREMALRVIRGMETALKGITLGETPPELGAVLSQITGGGKPEVDLVNLALRLGSQEASETARSLVLDRGSGGLSLDERRQLLTALAEYSSMELDGWLLAVAKEDPEPVMQRSALNGLRRSRDRSLAEPLLDIAAARARDPSVRATALTVLAGRPAWARALVDAIAEGLIPREALTIDQILVMQRHEQDASLQVRLAELWGRLRKPDAVKQERIRSLLQLLKKKGHGRPHEGAALFAQTCAACHRLFDRGASSGPDLTGYERSNLEFLVTATVDPNLGVREEFELTTVTLRPSPGSPSDTPGSILSGYVTEITDQQLTLKDLTGSELVMATAGILTKENSPISVMPEGLLDGLSDQQLRDLFAYLQAPEDPL